MADYYPLIARAVAGLDPAAPGETRRVIYERARGALIEQLRSGNPPMSESDITRERLALEDAVRRVETEAATRARQYVGGRRDGGGFGRDDYDEPPREETRRPTRDVLRGDAFRTEPPRLTRDPPVPPRTDQQRIDMLLKEAKRPDSLPSPDPRADAGRSEPLRPDTYRSEPLRSEPPRVEASRAEQQRSEPARPEIARDFPRTELPRNELPRAELSRADMLRAELLKVDSVRDEPPPRDEQPAAYDSSARGDLARAEGLRAELLRGLARDEERREDANRNVPSRDDEAQRYGDRADIIRAEMARGDALRAELDHDFFRAEAARSEPPRPDIPRMDILRQEPLRQDPPRPAEPVRDPRAERGFSDRERPDAYRDDDRLEPPPRFDQRPEREDRDRFAQDPRVDHPRPEAARFKPPRQEPLRDETHRADAFRDYARDETRRDDPRSDELRRSDQRRGEPQRLSESRGERRGLLRRDERRDDFRIEPARGEPSRGNRRDEPAQASFSHPPPVNAPSRERSRSPSLADEARPRRLARPDPGEFLPPAAPPPAARRQDAMIPTPPPMMPLGPAVAEPKPARADDFDQPLGRAAPRGRNVRRTYANTPADDLADDQDRGLHDDRFDDDQTRGGAFDDDFTPQEPPRFTPGGRPLPSASKLKDARARFPLKSAIAIGVALIVAGAAIVWGPKLYSTMRALLRAGTSVSDGVQSSPAIAPRPKIADRVGQPGEIAPVAQRVVLYDEDPAEPAGKQYVGTVIWRTEPVRGASAGDIAVRGDVEIPDRKFKMTLSFRRNTDTSLPASHTAELTFVLPSDFAGGGVANVPGILMKSNEQARGTPLAGLAVKVTDGFFLVGLSNVEADRARNLQLLKERSWFDVPLVYTNQRRAIIAIEKGSPGERAFNDAFAVWRE